MSIRVTHRFAAAVLAVCAVLSGCTALDGSGDSGPEPRVDPATFPARWTTIDAASLAPGEVLPADRRTEWNPGVTYGGGGIPQRTTTCAELTPSGGDDTTAIQGALDSCPPGQVVQLSAGTFVVTGKGLSVQRPEITLRGAGSGAPGTGEGGTRLVKADREAERLFALIYVGRGGPDLRNPDYPAPSLDLAADAVAGTRTVRLASAEGLRPGDYVLVDHITNSDPTVVWSSRQGGPGAEERRWFNRQDRSLAQVMRITAIDGSDVTFETPFHSTFRKDFAAQVTRFVDDKGGPRFLERVGIEDVYLEGGMGGDYHGNVAVNMCGSCWVARVQSNLSTGTAIGLYSTYRSEIRDSYIHTSADPNPGGAGYLLGLNTGAADNLIENNIVLRGNKVLVARASGGGNVIAYNYLDDSYGDGYRTIQEVGLNAAHYTTPHKELFEGNLSFNFDGDSVWGNSIDITVFRNRFTGLRADTARLGLVDDGMRRAVGLTRFHYGYNFLGNVLGAPEQAVTGQDKFIAELTDAENLYADGVRPHVAAMWALGYNGEDTGQPLDRQVAATTLRHGNFDYVSGRVGWDDRLPRALPPSLYLRGKPAFFGDLPWPWVDAAANGATSTLPAKQRYDAMPKR